MDITCKNINYSYEGVQAIKDLSLEIQSGELVALLGPSGCGKTTLLRIIAGLLPMQEGYLYYGDQDISKWPPQKRNTAMVFQSYALFPHLSVGENIAYGLKAKGYKKDEIGSLVASYLEKVELKGLGHRMVQELSGGQQQRVALARSMVLKPDVLLFDEPLSNLDEKLRVQMRREIRRLQKESGITSVYVTHDQEEAMAIADRIVVMHEGYIQQIGRPKEVYHEPVNGFVSNFMGVSNIIRAQGGNKVYRPESIQLSPKGAHRGRVNWVEHLGSIEQIGISYQNSEVIAHRFSHRLETYKIELGGFVQFDLLGDGIQVGVD